MTKSSKTFEGIAKDSLHKYSDVFSALGKHRDLKKLSDNETVESLLYKISEYQYSHGFAKEFIKHKDVTSELIKYYLSLNLGSKNSSKGVINILLFMSGSKLKLNHKNCFWLELLFSRLI